MKRKLIHLINIVLLVIMIGCSPQTSPSESLKWPPDGLYFIKWDSYHGYFEDEEPFIQLSAVQVHLGSNPQKINEYKEFVLVSDGEEIKATPTGINEGAHTKEYSLISLGLRLPKVKASKIILSKLKLTDPNNEQKTYDIGKWVLDIRKSKESQDLKLGKKTFASGVFDYYKAEIANTTNKPIHVKDLEFQLAEPYSVKITTTDNFNSTNTKENDNSLNAGQTKAFQFNFANNRQAINTPKFISLRPFLHYEIDNQAKTMILPTAIYSPSIGTDKEIFELIK
ncbi:hypothetical protein [Effusibacillus consociatus]|uniref:Lipoprotein n=1 Tax=Effusibacillus consociatus TaxID=1117041 RepID=A0ABV9Q2T2_9BACL